MNLNQVTVPVLAITTSIAFYEKLGLILIVKSDHYARFTCPIGHSTFSIHLADKLPLGKGVTIYFEVEDLDTKVNSLQELGLEFDHPPTDQRWLWREASLKDPDGNQLILFYAGHNRKNPPWRIN